VGEHGPPVFFVYPELVVSLSNHCRGATLSTLSRACREIVERACPEHLSRACRGIVEGLPKEFTLSSSKGPRLLAIVSSRDGHFGPVEQSRGRWARPS